jgi:hypothetical protein
MASSASVTHDDIKKLIPAECLKRNDDDVEKSIASLVKLRNIAIKGIERPDTANDDYLFTWVGRNLENAKSMIKAIRTEFIPVQPIGSPPLEWDEVIQIMNTEIDALRSMKAAALKATPDQWRIYGKPPTTRELSVIITNLVNDYESRNDFALHVYNTLKMTGEVQMDDVQDKFDLWMTNFTQIQKVLDVPHEETAVKFKQQKRDIEDTLKTLRDRVSAAGGTSTAAAAATGATQKDSLQRYKEWIWNKLPLRVRNHTSSTDDEASEGFKFLVLLHDFYEPIVQHFASQLGMSGNTDEKERKVAFDKWIEQMKKVKQELRVGTYSEIPAAVRRQLQNGATPAVTVPDASAASGNTPAVRAPDASSAVVDLNIPVQHEIEELKRNLYNMETKLKVSQRLNAMLEQRVRDAENGSFETSRHFQLHEKLSNLLDELNGLLHMDFATDTTADGDRMVNQIHSLICSALTGPDMDIVINKLIIELLVTVNPYMTMDDVNQQLEQLKEFMNGSYNPIRSRTDGGSRHERASDDTGHEAVQVLTGDDEAVYLAQPVTDAVDQAATAQPSARDGSAAPRDEAGASHAAAAQSSARGNSAATAGAGSREAGARDPSQRSGVDEWFAGEVAAGNMVVHKGKDGSSIIELNDLVFRPPASCRLLLRPHASCQSEPPGRLRCCEVVDRRRRGSPR